jgi:indole-3-glycerol phosphate synthase
MSMDDFLKKIVARKREEVEASKRRVPQAEVEGLAGASAKPRNFFKALTQPKGELRVIAEVKKKSPSGGMIVKEEDFDPVRIARAYDEAGAAAISCLTDEVDFGGSLGFIAAIKGAVELPVLRKDFVIDPYQVYESRAAGADAVLLIAECLDEALLVDLLILAAQLQLTTLVEVHDVENLLRVRPYIGFPCPSYTFLGINNRDLRTMKTDVGHTLRLLGMVENLELLVSESGIRTAGDVARLREAGVHRVLVGEHLLRQADVGAALRELMGGSESHP